jgi:hypothetical protein
MMPIVQDLERFLNDFRINWSVIVGGATKWMESMV